MFRPSCTSFRDACGVLTATAYLRDPHQWRIVLPHEIFPNVAREVDGSCFIWGVKWQYATTRHLICDVSFVYSERISERPKADCTIYKYLPAGWSAYFQAYISAL